MCTSATKIFFESSPSTVSGRSFPQRFPKHGRVTLGREQGIMGSGAGKSTVHGKHPILVKNISQNGSFPQIGVKIKIFETTT